MVPGPYEPMVWVFSNAIKIVLWLVALIGVKTRKVKKAKDEDLIL